MMNRLHVTSGGPQVSQQPHILVVAHDSLVADLFTEMLPARGYHTRIVQSHDAAIDALNRAPCDLVIAADEPPICDARALVWWVRESTRDLDVILLSKGLSRDVAIASESSTVYDVVSLPLVSLDAVLHSVQRALDKRAVALENRRLGDYLVQANEQIETVNQQLAALLAERTRQVTYLSQANSQIEHMNRELERLVAERTRQLNYLAQANEQVDGMNRELEQSVEQRSRQLEYLAQANAQIEEMNTRLEIAVAERTRTLQEANARLEALSLTDDVTGLYNQRWLRARLGEECQRAERHGHDLAVLMLDVDDFKLVNDNHDHIFGSRVLKRVGDILRTAVRGIDVAVRYGGDEFVVLLPQTSLPGAVAVAERLRVTVARTDVGEAGQPYHVTVSIGVAALRDLERTDPIELLKAADRALYSAKDCGKNRVGAMSGDQPVTTVG